MATELTLTSYLHNPWDGTVAGGTDHIIFDYSNLSFVPSSNDSYKSTSGDVFKVYVDGVRIYRTSDSSYAGGISLTGFLEDGDIAGSKLNGLTTIDNANVTWASTSDDVWTINTADQQILVDQSAILATDLYGEDGKDISFTSGTTIIELRRSVNDEISPSVDFSNASILTEQDLDNSSKNVFHLAQQAIVTAEKGIVFDTGAGTWDAQQAAVDKKIRGVAAPVEDNDVVNKGFLSGNLDDINTVADKATEIGRLGTADAVADMALLGTTACVADMAILGSTDTVADLAILGTTDVVADLAILGTTDVVADMALLGTTDAVADMALLGTSDTVADMALLGTSDVVADMALLGTSDCVADMALLGTSDCVADMAILGTSDVVADMAILGSTTVTDDMAILGSTTVTDDMAILGSTTVTDDMAILGASGVVTNIAAVAGKATEIGRLGTADAVADMALLGTSDVVADMAILGSTTVTDDMAILGSTTVTDDMALLAVPSVITDMDLLGASGVIDDMALLAVPAVITDMDLLGASGVIADIATVTDSGNLAAINGAAGNATAAATSATAASASEVAARASAAAVSQTFDNFADVYLGSMADGATADTGTLTGASWSKDSSSIAFTGTTGTISVGQELTSTGSGYPVGANIIGSSVSTPLTVSAPFTSAGSGTLTFVGSGVYGAYDVSKDGPSTDNDGDALAVGMLYFNSTDNEMRIYGGSTWIAATSAGSTSLLIYKYIATAAQTTFTGSDANSATLAYTVNNINVFLNGVRLDASDYTATNGTSVVLGSGAALSDELIVTAYKSFTVADMVPASTGGTFSGNITAPNQATTGKSIAMAIVFGS